MLTRRLNVICYECRKTAFGMKPCDGDCFCPVDDQPIMLHVHYKFCPDNKFPTASPLVRAFIWFIHRTGIKQWVVRKGWYEPKTCGCAVRAGWINRAWDRSINTARAVGRKLRLK